MAEKSTRPKIKFVDVQTGEEIEREMNDDEYEIYLADAKQLQDNKKLEAEKAIRKAELLERLGITEDEAKLLLG